MSLTGINFSGLQTGIDSDSIIKQLISLQQRPILALQRRQQQIQQQQGAINQVSGLVTGLMAAAAALDRTTSFSLVKGASSDATLASISAESGASAGAHTLEIIQRAQAHRLGSAARSSQTDPLGVSGQIVVNGKAVNVAATDSLQTLAANINAARVGVTASVVATSSDSYTLVLAASRTGTASAISLSDTGGGTILQSTLGILGASTGIRSPIANGAASSLFADSSSSVGTLIGLTSPPSGTIQINGTGVALDLASDSLSAIAGKINAAGIAGVTASVATVKDAEGVARQQLRVTGTTTPTFVDSNGILTNLGILQNTPTSQLSEARDAKFKLDGLDLTRSSNTVTDALAGVTINLLKDSGTADLSNSSDTETIRKNIETFVNAYNQLVRTVGNLAAFDPQTLVSGPLFGDVTIQNVVNTATQLLTDQVEGLGGIATLAQIGITLDQSNLLNINATDLDAALNGKLDEVARLFRASGIATNTAVTFISSTEKTKPSPSAGYAINITQLATQAKTVAGTAHTADDNPSVEVLTFTGGQFGTSGVSVLLDANSTLDDIVAKINADEKIGGYLTASNEGGRLALTAKQYGSQYGFTVASSQEAAANNSGIGSAPITSTALDVAGTINGEAATGKGQFLTGDDSSPNVAGLQVRITAAAAGDLGTLSFTKGIANAVTAFARGVTDSLEGTLTVYSSSMDGLVKDIGDQITALQERLKAEELRLRRQFQAMEDAVSKLRAAGNGLAALAAPTTTSGR